MSTAAGIFILLDGRSKQLLLQREYSISQWEGKNMSAAVGIFILLDGRSKQLLLQREYSISKREGKNMGNVSLFSH